jgi:hypothetical protein
MPSVVEKRTKSWSDPASASEAIGQLPRIDGEVKKLRDELAEEVRGLKKDRRVRALHLFDEYAVDYCWTCGARLDLAFSAGDVSCSLWAYSVRADEVYIPPNPAHHDHTLAVGSSLALALYQPTELHEVPASLALLLNEYDISLSWPSLSIPQIDLAAIENEWRRLTSSIPEPWKLNNDGREFQVGEAMRDRGLTAHYPVILVPGVISTVRLCILSFCRRSLIGISWQGLESWSTSPEYRTFFRQKVWGGFGMLSQVTFNRDKWMAAMMLDPGTGIDPPGVKVRAAEGLDAASSFIQGYWIW